MINPFLFMILGIVLLSWGGGMTSVHYLINNDNPFNTVNAFGVIIMGLGFAITIKTLSVMRHFVEVIRD